MCHQQFDPFLLVGGTGSKLHLYHGTFAARACVCARARVRVCVLGVSCDCSRRRGTH
jgi:hypothetical protein